MNFTRPINSSSTDEKHNNEEQTLAPSFFSKERLLPILKYVGYTLLGIVLLIAILFPFLPWILSVSWIKSYYLGAFLPEECENVTLEIGDVEFSWGETQMLRNVTFRQKTPTETREIFIEEVTLKSSLLALAPWHDDYQLVAQLKDVEVVRTPIDQANRYRVVSDGKPLTTSLTLDVSIEEMQLYPLGKMEPFVQFDTAQLKFENPNQPLAFEAKGQAFAAQGKALGQVNTSFTLQSLNAFLKSKTLTTLFNEGNLSFNGEMGEVHLVALKENGNPRPTLRARGTLNLDWLASRNEFRPYLGDTIQSFAGTCQWSAHYIDVNRSKVECAIDFSLNVQRICYEDTFYTFENIGGRVDMMLPFVDTNRQITLSNLELDLPVGRLEANAEIADDRLKCNGILHAELLTLWATPRMDGLREEGVQMEGTSTITFELESPLTFDRHQLFESSTASISIPCERLTLPEITLPHITFDLRLENALLYCRGDFKVRDRAFNVCVTQADLFDSEPINSRTLRTYLREGTH
jgi:hypothetical protein